MEIKTFIVLVVVWFPICTDCASITGNQTDNLEQPTVMNPPVLTGNHSGIDEYYGAGNHENRSNHGDDEHHGIHVASWNYKYVEQPFIIAFFLLVAGICKLGFHHADFLPSMLPESCLLIILGTIVGLILHVSKEDEVFPIYLTPRLFFLFLLPPIILESAYSLHDRVFFDNVGTVLLYAVLGTILNCFIIGSVLFLLADIGAMGPLSITVVECLVFSSLIVAVDPVAVLAIFQEIGVNNVLYFLVFGESLLNDAVTVVLYNTMKTFNVMEEITAPQILLGVAAFFTVSLGGLFVGLLFGMFTAIITKYTENVRVVEPLAIFVLAYMSYLGAEMFHFSGIISIIGCGLMQANYAFHNISQKSYTTVKYFSKMQSATSDCVIFMFLGMTLFRSELVWHTGFVLWSLFLCLAVRFLVVFSLTFLANKVNRLKKIDLEEQFIMAYGGLRGAVCFSLVDLLEPSSLPHKNMFVTTSLAVIFFTVFVQGISIKPLVKFFRISLKEQKSLCIYEEINIHVTDHVMAGIEEILGKKGQYFWREILDYYDAKYLRHVFQRTPSKTDEKIMEMFEKIALRQHFENLSSNKFPEMYDGGIMYEEESASDTEADSMENFPEDLDYVSENPELLDQELEKYEKAKDEYMRRKSRAFSLIPAIKAADKRRESRAMVRQDTRAEHMIDPTTARRDSKVSDIPTVEDIRKMLVRNPTDVLHQEKTDKNLKKENQGDILQLLQEKQARTRRMSMSIGNRYDGIFQGALLQSRLGGMSPLTLSRSKMTSIEEDHSASSTPKDKRKRAQSTFTPADLDKLKRLKKIRSAFKRSATVAYQGVDDHDADDRSPLLGKSQSKAEHDLRLSADSGPHQDPLSSPSGSGEKLNSSWRSAEKLNSPSTSREKVNEKPISSPDRNRQRERMRNWRRAKTKKAQTFDVPAPLEEEGVIENVGTIKEEDNDFTLSSPAQSDNNTKSGEIKNDMSGDQQTNGQEKVEMSSLSLPDDGLSLARNRSYTDAIGQDMVGAKENNSPDEHIV